MKRVFVSDIHMSAGWSLGQGSMTYDWFDKEEAAAFEKFLGTLVVDDTVDEVVLLGDIMDVWIYPYKQVAAKYSDIVSAGHVKPIIASINDLAAKKKQVVYVSGNHDIDIMDTAFASFRQSTFPQVKFMSSYDSKDGILAMHGHEYVMWNAPDPKPTRTPPIGYYISRMIATIDSLGKLRYTFGNIATALFSHPGAAGSIFVNGPLDFLAPQANMNDQSEFVTPNGKFALGDVRQDYASLASDWSAAHGIDGPIRSVRREAVGLWDAATSLAWRTGNKVIIFGHTHNEENCLLSPPGDSSQPYAIYANSGSWCCFNDHDDPKPYTYIVTEYDGTTHTVTTMHWGGKPGSTNAIS